MRTRTSRRFALVGLAQEVSRSPVRPLQLVTSEVGAAGGAVSLGVVVEAEALHAPCTPPAATAATLK